MNGNCIHRDSEAEHHSGNVIFLLFKNEWRWRSIICYKDARIPQDEVPSIREVAVFDANLVLVLSVLDNDITFSREEYNRIIVIA